MGLHEPPRADAQLDRLRRAGSPAVTSPGEADAEHVHRGQAGIDGRRQSVEQRLLERRVRRRRTERQRDRPPRQAGATDGGVPRPMGGDRSARSRTCRCRPVRTRVGHRADRGGDPPPEHRSRRVGARRRGRRARRQLGQTARQPCPRRPDLTRRHPRGLHRNLARLSGRGTGVDQLPRHQRTRRMSRARHGPGQDTDRARPPRPQCRSGSRVGHRSGRGGRQLGCRGRPLRS